MTAKQKPTIADLQREVAALRAELEQRSAELIEAQAQQAAAAEVLQVINFSPGDLAPVFDAMLEKAMRLCEAAFGGLWLFGDRYVATALRGVPQAYADFLRGSTELPGPGTGAYRFLHGERSIIHNLDLADEEPYRTGQAGRVALVDLGGARTALQVPLCNDEAVLGLMTIYRQEVRPFTDRQIALLQNFAAQAVIAMENARLLGELREQTDQLARREAELRESNDRYGLVSQAVAEGIYDWDIAHNALWVSARLIEIFGWDDAKADDPARPSQDWNARVHPEDFEQYRSALRASLKGETERLHCEYRIRVKTDEYRWVEDHALALRDESGWSVRLVGAVSDVTERKQREQELREALDQQTATAEVLGVINASPGDLAPVFDAVLEKAMRFCEAGFSELLTYDGVRFNTEATRGVPEAFAEYRRHNLAALPRPGSLGARVLESSGIVHILDLKNEPTYEEGDPNRRAIVDLGGARTALIVPLRKDSAVLGFIILYRQEVLPFTDKQIALLQNFAAQAVIAMENARLITETREALDQQTATAEVLQVINSSPGDLAPVFAAMLEKAMRLCEAETAHLLRYENGAFSRAASLGVPEGFDEILPIGQPMGHVITRDSVPFRMLAARRTIPVLDVREDDSYRAGAPAEVAAADEAGIRSALFVPLLREGEVIGCFVMHRTVVRAFTDKQVALIENFAAQAVIAMENARLVTETQEALDQQTATAEVLGVINSSPGDLKPVFDAILEKAHSLCGADQGHLTIYDGAQFRAVASHNVPKEFTDKLRQPFRPGHDFAERMIAGERVIHIPDMAALMPRPDDDIGRGAIEIAGIRTLLFVPLRKDGRLLGYITAHREEVRPFTDKQIALLQNFAAQAVIAMENARLITETREALAQQTATAEVLGVINSSPGDLAPVFDAMLEKAMRLCEATYGHLVTFDGEFIHIEALTGDPRLVNHFRNIGPVRPPPLSVVERMLGGENVVHMQDTADDLGSRVAGSLLQALADIGGTRSLLGVALRKDRAFLGAIVVYRQEIRPFTDKQIALLENFAAQAVIAMENARLLTETREALEQQTATTEVLQVINSSPGDLAPVFDTVVKTAARLCSADMAFIFRRDGELYGLVANFGFPPEYEKWLRDRVGFIPRTQGGVSPRVALERRTIHVLDLSADPEFYLREAVELGKMRTVLGVPLLRDGEPVGVIALARQNVEAFGERQIALVENFAAQAVIAMENARLITETQEALDQQTATAEVLRVISGSATDLQPVFEAIVERASNLCEAEFSGVARFEDGLLRLVAVTNLSDNEAAAFHSLFLREPSRGFVMGRAFVDGRPVHVEDVLSDPEYDTRTQQILQSRTGYRTFLGVPILRDGKPIGVIGCGRREVKGFSPAQIDLVTTFADQAVIAIENARLFNDLRSRTDDLTESLEYQTATSEVLKVISRSTFDLQPVLDTLVQTAARLCNADLAHIATRDGEVYRPIATFAMTAEFDAAVRALSFAVDRKSLVGRVLIERAPVQIADVAADPEYAVAPTLPIGKVRSLLGVPLLRQGEPLGVIALARQRSDLFTERQIGLVQTFADQAVIAIENARLLTETREARDSAETSLRDLKSAQANLIQAEKMASLGQLTAGIAHEIKNPLNFVNNFATLSNELLEELKEIAAPALDALGGEKRAELDEVVDMLTGNLDKIAEHGRRADNIVKSMLAHSRGGSGERQSVDLNVLVEESLNLAYHGARAQDQTFNITLERDYAPALKPIELVPQDMTRVFLNLFANGFYAANKRAGAGGDASFRPVLKVATREGGGEIEITVRDNGAGIPPKIKDKLFQPFFTTKPTGEGTGLGLSISYDIVTQQHGGSIAVESRVGEYTEFTIRLPYAGRAAIPKTATPEAAA